jgi:hypothetical protein
LLDLTRRRCRLSDAAVKDGVLVGIFRINTPSFVIGRGVIKRVVIRCSCQRTGPPRGSAGSRSARTAQSPRVARRRRASWSDRRDARPGRWAKPQVQPPDVDADPDRARSPGQIPVGPVARCLRRAFDPPSRLEADGAARSTPGTNDGLTWRGLGGDPPARARPRVGGVA